MATARMGHPPPPAQPPAGAATATTAVLLERRHMFFEDVFAASVPRAQAAARCIQRAVRCYAARQQGRRLRRLRDQRLAERLMEQPVGQAVDLPPGLTPAGVLSCYETGLLERQERVRRKLLLNEERVARADITALQRWLHRGKPLVHFLLQRLEHEELHARMRLWREQDEGMADLAAQIGETAQRLQLGERWRGRQTSAAQVQRQWRGCFARRLRRKLQAQREEEDAEAALEKVEQRLRQGPRPRPTPQQGAAGGTLPPLGAADPADGLPECSSPAAAAAAPPVIVHPCTADSLPPPARTLPALKPKKQSARKLMKGVYSDMRTRLQAMHDSHGDALLPLLSSPAPR